MVQYSTTNNVIFIYYTLVKHVHTWEVALPAVSGLRFLLNAAKKEILSIPAKLNLQYRVPSKGHLEQGLFSVVASTKLELFFFFSDNRNGLRVDEKNHL